MSGRSRLSWVTALTVASLLLGGGALNALADEHGNGWGHNSGPGNVEHQQQATEVRQDDGRGPNRGDDEDDDLVTPPVRATGDIRPGKGCGDENHEHLRNAECKDKHNDADDDDD
jgi:hypothetical protein